MVGEIFWIEFIYLALIFCKNLLYNRHYFREKNFVYLMYAGKGNFKVYSKKTFYYIKKYEIMTDI